MTLMWKRKSKSCPSLFGLLPTIASPVFTRKSSQYSALRLLGNNRVPLSRSALAMAVVFHCSGPSSSPLSIIF